MHCHIINVCEVLIIEPIPDSYNCSVDQCELILNSMYQTSSNQFEFDLNLNRPLNTHTLAGLAKVGGFLSKVPAHTEPRSKSV